MAKDGYLSKFFGMSEEEAEELKRKISATKATEDEDEDEKKVLSEGDFIPPSDSMIDATDEDGKPIRAALFYDHKRLVTDAEANDAVRLWDVDRTKFEYCKYSTKNGRVIPGTPLQGPLGEWTPKRFRR